MNKELSFCWEETKWPRTHYFQEEIDLGKNTEWVNGGLGCRQRGNEDQGRPP